MRWYDRFVESLRVPEKLHRLAGYIKEDRLGLAIFISSLLFFGLTWRTGFFINDNWTIANSLANVADGHLAFQKLVYGPEPGAHPGMHIVDGKLYGRNYGLVFMALPFLWLVEAVSAISELAVAIGAVWSLGLIWLANYIAPHTRYAREVRWGGLLIAIATFALNAWFAPAIQARWHPHLALQLMSIVAAAFLVLLMYRLVTKLYSTQVGVVTALALAAGTPIGFWASIPKRHIMIALLAFLTFVAFARSRKPGDKTLLFRAIGYGAVGLSAWVFPAEAVLLFFVYAPLDLVTAPSNRLRELVLLLVVFGLALLPSFLTNYVIAGNPFEPPMLWPSYNGEIDVLGGPSEPTGSETNGATDSGPGASAGGPLLTLITSVASGVSAAISETFPRLLDDFSRGFAVIVGEPERLYHTFIRSGWIELRDTTGINLSVIETAPILGLLAGALANWTKRLASCEWNPHITFRELSTKQYLDIFAIGYITLFTIIYIQRLPLNSMVTVRYLVPTLPFLLYLVAGLPQYRHAVMETISMSFAAGTVSVIGTQLFVLWLLLVSPTLGEAMQLHALLGLMVATLLGLWAFLEVFTNHSLSTVGGVMVGTAIGVMVLFTLTVKLLYLTHGDVVLGGLNALAELIGQQVLI